MGFGEDELGALGGQQGAEDAVVRGKIHIRKQQRNGRKCYTLTNGVPNEFNYKKILKYLKRELNCNGVIVDSDDFGKVLQLQGDFRKEVADFLYHEGIAEKDQIMAHMN